MTREGSKKIKSIPGVYWKANKHTYNHLIWSNIDNYISLESSMCVLFIFDHCLEEILCSDNNVLIVTTEGSKKIKGIPGVMKSQ